MTISPSPSCWRMPRNVEIIPRPSFGPSWQAAGSSGLLEALARSAGVSVADGDRQGIGGIIRTRLVVHLEQQPHHGLHLLLVGAAVADHCLLDLSRRLFLHRDRMT